MHNHDYKLMDLAGIAIREYGFVKTEKSTQNSPSLKNAKGDHIVIKVQPDGAHTFFSPTSEHKGSIFDFVMWQENCDFQAAGEKIRYLLGREMEHDFKAESTAPQHKSFDREAVKKLKVLTYSKYLESRGIHDTLLQHGRFKGTIFIDEHNNVVFPHCKGKEIVGYVKKNYKFSGFSEGGEKLLWKSNQFPSDTRLVVCEAAIDGLSYATMLAENPKHKERFFHTRFISIDGGMSPEAEKALRTEVASLPEEAVVEAAFDNDKQGEKYTAKLQEICSECNRQIKIAAPKQKKDWNEVLQAYRERQGQKAAAASDPVPSVPETLAPTGAENPAAADKSSGESSEKVDAPASGKQKALIIELAHQHYLNPVPKNIMDTLSKDKASSIIRAGLARKEKNEPAPAEKNMATQKQRQAVWSLARQGFIPEIRQDELNKLTFAQAAEMISAGKKRSLDGMDTEQQPAVQKKTNKKIKMHV